MGLSGNERQHILQAAAERHDVTFVPLLLQAAFTYCAEVLEPATLATFKRVELLRVLTDLSNTLRQGETTLAPVIDAALEQAGAGARLREALQEGEEQLARRVQELDQIRAALTPLLQQEATLQEQAAEYDNLKRRHAELERLANLTPHLHELPKQVEELTQRLAHTGQEALHWEQCTETKATSLIVLSTAALANLETRVQQALAEAERLEKARDSAACRLREAQTRAEHADAALKRINSELLPHLEANQAVAQALPKNTAPQTLLDEAERLLRQADEALQGALKTQAETQRLAKLALMERQHGHPA